MAKKTWQENAGMVEGAFEGATEVKVGATRKKKAKKKAAKKKMKKAAY